MYNRYNGGTTINRAPDDPTCFGLHWESDDPDCRYNCDEYYRCGREYRRVRELKDRKRDVPAKSREGSKTRAMSRREPGRDGLVRPSLPSEMPPGTEYLPPGRHGPVSRAMSIAFAEGVGAGGGTFFDSLGDFMRDIPAWHRHAGRRTYGKKWKDQRESLPCLPEEDEEK